jgi:hypothetical protein
MDYCKYEDHLNYAEHSEWLMYYGRLALELFTNCKTLNYSNAIHEAGHAALNECLGYKVKSVGIYPQKVTEIEPVTKQDAETCRDNRSCRICRCDISYREISRISVCE